MQTKTLRIMTKLYRFLIISTVLFVVQNVNAQIVKVSQSGKSVYPFAEVNDQILANGDDTYYHFYQPKIKKKKRDQNHLIHFDAKGNASYNVLSVPDDITYMFNFITMHRGNYVTAYAKDKASKSFKRSLLKISNDGKSTDRIELDQFDVKEYGDIPSELIAKSKNNMHLALVTVVDENEKNEELSVRILGLDESLNKKYSTVYRPKRKNSQELYHVIDVAINELGTVYFLMKVYGEKYKEKKKGAKGDIVANYHHVLIKVEEDGELKEHPLATDGSYFLNLKIFFDQANNPRVIGPARELIGQSEVTRGVHVHVYNSDKDSFDLNKNELSVEQKRTFGIGVKTKFNKSISDYYGLLASHIVDGDKMHIALERGYTFNQNQNTGKYINVQTWFVRESAIILTLDESGAIVEDLYIPKFYRSLINSPSSLTHHNKQPILVYMDYDENLNVSSNDYSDYEPKKISLTYEKDHLVVAYKVDNALAREKVPLKYDKKTTLAMHNSFVTEDGKFKVIVLNPVKLKVESRLATLEFTL